MRAPSLKTTPFSSGKKIITNKANPLWVHRRRERLRTCWGAEGTLCKCTQGANAIQKVPRFYLTVLKESFFLLGWGRNTDTDVFKGASVAYAGSLGQRNTLAITRGLLTRNLLICVCMDLCVYSQRTSTLNCAESNNSKMEPEVDTIFCTTQEFCMSTKFQQIINTNGAFSIERHSSNLYTLAPSWPKERKLLDSRAPGNGTVARERTAIIASYNFLSWDEKIAQGKGEINKPPSPPILSLNKTFSKPREKLSALSWYY